MLGIKGKRTYTREKTLNEPSASLTLLTALDQDVPFYIDYRISSNTQWDFAEFLLQACKAGYLSAGDFLVLDNAAVHVGVDSYDVIKSILDTFQVRIIKLPTYSPELNPCELVFSQLKQHIRNNRGNSSSLCGEVLASLANVSIDNLYNYYLKCLFPKVILPDFF